MNRLNLAQISKKLYRPDSNVKWEIKGTVPLNITTLPLLS